MHSFSLRHGFVSLGFFDKIFNEAGDNVSNDAFFSFTRFLSHCVFS